jgi:hypothetical protein
VQGNAFNLDGHGLSIIMGHGGRGGRTLIQRDQYQFTGARSHSVDGFIQGDWVYAEHDPGVQIEVRFDVLHIGRTPPRWCSAPVPKVKWG